MKKSSAAASPSCKATSKKPNLRSTKAQSPSPVQFNSLTPEKPPQQRTRNRGVALSVAEVRKVAKGLQDRKQRSETTSSQARSVRRQISLPSPSKSKNADDEPFDLPQKYQNLEMFFVSLVSSIRLKRWKETPTFTKICPIIEDLTDMRFTHRHLAQLKFILPEAIVIKKVLVPDSDERRGCLKPDLHISINLDAVEFDDVNPEHGRVSPKKLARIRLREFWESHPEGDQIPEETLPEPFNHLAKDSVLHTLKTRAPVKLSSCMRYNDIVNNAESVNVDEKLSVPVKTSVELPSEHLTAPSHLPPSFRPRFSQKFKQNRADDVQQRCLLDPLQPLAFPVSESRLKENPPSEDTESHLETSPAKFASETASSERCPTICASLESCGPPPATLSKTIEYTENKTENKDGSLKNIDDMSTPAKLVSTPIRLMSVTPALCSPKRHYMSPDDNSTSSLNKLARRPPRSRSLKFDTPVKNKEVVNEDNAGSLPIDDDVFAILPENLIQSIREKERMAMEERDPAISQAKKRKKNIASLPKLFDKIRLLFRQRSCITRVELASKIISSHFDIVDRSEVEEQLNLLLELVPEWISEKLVSSGDLLFFINKMSSPETIRASLEAAK